MHKYLTSIAILIFFSSCKQEKKEDIITVIVENTRPKKDSDTSTINQLKYFVKPVNEKIIFHEQKNYNTYIEQKNYKDSLTGYNAITKLVLRDSFEIYSNNTTFNYKRYYFPPNNNNNNNNDNDDNYAYILKKQVINSQHMYREGNGFTKNILSFYKIENGKKLSTKPEYSFTGYSDEVKILDEDGYFLTSSYGCCASPDYFELFDLKGKKIISSNHIIHEISTTKESSKYYVSVLFENSEDSPRLIIRYPDDTIQELVLEINNFIFYNYYSFDVYRKNKKNHYNSGNYNSNLYSKTTVDSIDNVQIVIPVFNKDMLRIPFINGKPFGRSDKQLLISLDSKAK